MKLLKPDIQYKSEYLDMMGDWYRSEEELVPFPLKYDHSDFESFVQQMKDNEQTADNGFVCHSTYWLFNEDGKIVGVSNIRHELNDHLLKDGGHIGYGVRPSCRRRGYATKLLELSLLKAKDMGIDRALVTCDRGNVASSKTIIKNGGVLWKEHEHNGVMKQLYWIDLSPS